MKLLHLDRFDVARVNRADVASACACTWSFESIVDGVDRATCCAIVKPLDGES